MMDHTMKNLEIERDEKGQERQKRRTLSPIRDALRSTKKLKSLYCEQESAGNDVTPAPLSKVINRHCYRLSSINSDLLQKVTTST